MEDTTEKPATLARHCAFCLLSITGEEIKLCGTCHRRAYCSKQCQTADWSLKHKGQGHKNWCHLKCGEEDLDWEVAPVSGKGLGLMAKRLIPAGFRIIVDACRAKDHPGIKDLMPLNGTDDEKFLMNCLGCGDDDDALCLRISRANHQCGANAEHVYDETFKVKVLFSEKDIQEGEEICISYQTHFDISTDTSATEARAVLQIKWGITCPQDCYCYDSQVEEIIQESRELDSEIFRLGSLGTSRSVDAALIRIKKLLENLDNIQSSSLNKYRANFDGFQIAVMKRSTLNQAKEFIEKAYALGSRMRSPQSEVCLKDERYMKDLKTHSNYLNIG